MSEIIVSSGSEQTPNPGIFSEGKPNATSPNNMRHSDYQVIRRDGSVVGFEPGKIAVAMTKAFLAVHGAQSATSSAMREQVDQLTANVIRALMRRKPEGGAIPIEDIQDQVELALMRSGEHEVARAYVLYRERRAQERLEQAKQAALKTQTQAPMSAQKPVLRVTDAQGKTHPLDVERLTHLINSSCAGLTDVVAEKILKATLKDLYDGVPMIEVRKAVVLAGRTLIEKDPAYSYVTARLLLDSLRFEALGFEATQDDMATQYAKYFPESIRHGIEIGLLNPDLADFDLAKLAAALKPERDLQFGYLGLQTLYDRYFLNDQYDGGRRFELPQCFFMRVAMGLALKENDREARAIEFYHLLSSFDFMSSTPTLFNSGTRHSQLSSCYLTTVSDDLDGIYEAIKENALLSKFAGGLGNDWSGVRAMGSHIKGTNGKSQGVVPFLKVVNDTAVAVNQGGKRKGAVCCYLESWHLDIEEFLELRKNTGDDRRRTHDMNTANWIPDLFMKRVMENGEWTLFSPSDAPDLHELWGKAFEKAYIGYEEKAARGEIRLSKKISAVQLWRKMLSMLFETGHPWMTFKDACNARSPQQHAGVVHSSNLCTEITLNTSADEIAVCNLGSVNLAAHLHQESDRWVLDTEKLRRTVTTAMRMLDNVIDINYYAVKKAETANTKHRPVGLGLMGFQDCLHKMHIAYASDEAVRFADTSMEAVCYYAYWASSDLAQERGVYSSYPGSLWSQGILPKDSLELLRKERGGYLETDNSATMDWEALRAKIRQDGMRNSNCVAIAPTATISNIVGVSASIEPDYQNLYVKSNLSGEFTIINEQLVGDLKRLDLWDAVMAADLKYFDGSLAKIDRIPQYLKHLYATAFEVAPQWIIEAAARRQKWIDQGQSLNIYIAAASGKLLDDTYKLAWIRGLKTTYYLRALAASAAEKSTGQGGELNAVSAHADKENAPKFCVIDDPTCEACQ